MAGDYQTPERMAIKRQAVPLTYITERSLLDVGCDHGAWCEAALAAGASRVVGIDRGREVPGLGWVDLAARNAAAIPGVEFHGMELGRQWRQFGRFDVVLMLNVYHHVYQVTGQHDPIWFWLWQHTDGQVLWEAPLSKDDPVAAQHVSLPYCEADIRAAAERYFDIEVLGPGWVPTRVVWRCWPRKLPKIIVAGVAKAGAGGATRAFEHSDGRRMDEIESVLGIRPIPGSLNVELPEPFDWDSRYYRSQVLDVADRGAGLESPWVSRWARFYPLTVDGNAAYAFRFEGEAYPLEFVELIADRRLRGQDVAILER